VDKKGRESRRELRWNRRTLMNCKVTKNKGGEGRGEDGGKVRDDSRKIREQAAVASVPLSIIHKSITPQHIDFFLEHLQQALSSTA
jgi:hypothetical protein